MGNLLTGPELDHLRGATLESLPDTAVVEASTLTSNQGGGGSVSWLPVGTYPCRVGPQRLNAGQETNQGERITAVAEVIITLPALTPVEVENRIVINGVHTYDVVAVKVTSYETTRRVEAQEVS